MRILGIETSGSAASCAILNDEKLEGEIYLNHKLQHSVILFPMIQKLLDEVEICMDDIGAVAVSGGPGSFTGLRIGVAAAKGIAQGGNKKFCAISSLDAMAFQAAQFSGIICPIVDALREDVYTAFYTWQEGELLKTKDYDVLNIDELLQTLYEKKENIIFCGDAVQKYKNKIEEKLENKAHFLPLSYSLPKASSLAELAKIRIEKGMEDDIYTYSPIYIRKSQAEREYEKKNGKSAN